jgi:hypothetical protein
VPLGAGDDPAAKSAQIRAVGLEHRDSRTVGAVDDMPSGPLTQEAGERLHLGKFRHGIDSAWCPGMFAPRRDADRYHTDNGWPMVV